MCETFNLQEEIAKYYDTGKIYQYEFIYVTDLWLEEPMLSRIATDVKLKNKFFVFDHHESALKEGFNKYSFTTIRIFDEKGLCSGTSLFYEYLTKILKIDDDCRIVKEFSELTRKYDTWEWNTKYHDEMPHKLSLLFDSIGCDGYIKLMYKKLVSSDDIPFFFNEMETLLICNKENQIKEKLVNYAKKVIYKEILGLTAGIVFIDYEYRNDLAEYFRKNHFDMDFAMLIALDYGTISYRSVKEAVNVRLIAEAMGGKGHDCAASSPISQVQKDEIVKTLSKRR